jgi:membrane fusion protein (multidrug efflux system)
VAEDFGDTLEALGTARANESVDITANVTETVDELFFEDGDRVKAGQVLVRLRQSEEEAALKAARARLDERRAAFERAKDLETQQALSTATLEERRALLSQIEGEVEVIESQVEDRIIRAPFDGMLGLREISVGALVRPGDRITTIDDLSRIKVDFEAPSVFLAALRPGLEIAARARAYPGRTFRGTVQTVNSRVDPSTRTVRVRAVLRNDDERLRPGLLLSVRLTKNARSALLVPEGAVVQRGETSRVFRIREGDAGTTAESVEVRLGARVPGKVEVLEGLGADDKVIVHGLMQVREGAQVRILGEMSDPGQPLSDFMDPGAAMGDDAP